ncbi:hypothetical protein [Flavihumibacter sp. ZG627]|uniref:hypothetical protein n=1 Tax=Flavihumibacter sp. ZG627 TaxID=1463156 RepID=UPI00057CAE67|nr:hypothetical protein [Flavihumibacter sp. ZG627]KIC91050.1 hypothetical protein HY58_08545 [Flavihumibacter sp. ZG627]
MNLCDRIVTKIPLEILWTSENELESQRIDYLTPTIIRDLLKQGEVYFIVADVGQKLLWIQPAECYEFWKSEIHKHVATNLDKINLENYPGNYAYIASKWTSYAHRPVVLLEKIH